MRLPASRDPACQSTGTLSQLIPERKIHTDVRPGPASAVHAERAAQSLNPVSQARQARSTRRIGPADAIVTGRQHQAPIDRGNRNLNTRRPRMLYRISQRLRHNVVRRDLDRLATPRIRRDIKIDRHRAAAGKHPQSRAKTTLRKNRRVDPARKILQFGHRIDQPAAMLAR